MRMTDEQIIEILETSPINYYTKSNDKVTQVYDRANSATYIDMVKNEITIGLRVFDKFDVVDESIVRAVFYHEVSHAILTKMDLLRQAKYTSQLVNKYRQTEGDIRLPEDEFAEIMNIIEDSRIEKALKNYYIDVDFPKFRSMLHKDVINAQDTPLLRFAKPLLMGVQNKYYTRIMTELQHLLKVNVTTDDYARVLAIYYDIIVDFYNNESPESNDGDEQQDNQENQNNQDNQDNQDGQDNRNHEVDSNNQESSNSCGHDCDVEQEKSPYELTNEETAMLISAALEMLKAEQEDEIAQKVLLDKLTRNHSVESLVRKITLKAKARAENPDNMNGGYGYSGTVNYSRIYQMKDVHYKIFNSGSGDDVAPTEFVINFYLDQSWSFINNQNVVNKMLRLLIDLENKLNKAFRFTLTTINDCNEKEVEGNQRQLRCDGGTGISPRLRRIFKKNYNDESFNILLLDGRAELEDRDLNYLDKKNVYICVDSTNAEYFNKFKKADVDLVSSRYAEHLEEFIIQTLKKIDRGL